MARYIDADIVHQEIEKLQVNLESNNDTIWKKNKPIYKGLCYARGIINKIPTADVVPRSEVVVASVISEISKMLKSSYNRKHAFVNDEFLRGRDGAYQEFIDILTEISRKNAEGEK